MSQYCQSKEVSNSMRFIEIIATLLFSSKKDSASLTWTLVNPSWIRKIIRNTAFRIREFETRRPPL